MRHCKGVWLLLLCAVLSCGGGGRELGDVGVEVAVGPNPPEVGPAVIAASLSDASGRPIEGATVEIEADMRDADLTPMTAPAAEVEPGRYEASVAFTEGGEWFVVVRADLPDGRKLERTVDIGAVLWVTP